MTTTQQVVAPDEVCPASRRWLLRASPYASALNLKPCGLSTDFRGPSLRDRGEGRHSETVECRREAPLRNLILLARQIRGPSLRDRGEARHSDAPLSKLIRTHTLRCESTTTAADAWERPSRDASFKAPATPTAPMCAPAGATAGTQSPLSSTTGTY
jgi:hypothetical protein